MMNGPVPTQAGGAVGGAAALTFDIKGLGQPFKFNGSDKDWPEWSFVVRNFLIMNKKF